MDEKEKIEKIMQIENMNSVQFAAEIGIQGSTLSHILNGRNKPSLEVLKKILNRFRTINSDWLILDIGSMYRQEKHSQTPTLFDPIEEIPIKSVDYIQKSVTKNDFKTDANNIKEQLVSEISNQITPEPNFTLQQLVQAPPRSVKKIIVYYSDNTFQELETKN